MNAGRLRRAPRESQKLSWFTNHLLWIVKRPAIDSWPNLNFSGTRLLLWTAWQWNEPNVKSPSSLLCGGWWVGPLWLPLDLAYRDAGKICNKINWRLGLSWLILKITLVYLWLGLARQYWTISWDFCHFQRKSLLKKIISMLPSLSDFLWSWELWRLF